VAPSQLTVTAVAGVQLQLAWTSNAPDADGFKVERKTGISGSYSEIGSAPISNPAFLDSNVQIGVTYYYRVRAYTVAGGYTAYSNEAGGTPVDAIPAPPTNLTANAVYASQIELAWVINSTNETGFSVQRKVGAGGTYALLVRLPPRTSSYIDTSILPSTTYFYQVQANGTAGDSPWSNEASATTTAQPAPTAPSNLAAATT